jgi:hypothetical protein
VFAHNSTFNYLERWVAPYNEGTARYRLDDFTGALQLLEEALDAVPPERECLVRINLALAHESVGDAADARGDAPAAAEEWREGIAVLSEGGCLEPDRADNAGARDARAVDGRLRAKLEEPDLSSDPETDAPESRDQARANALQDRTERAERQRRRSEQRRQDREDEKPAHDGAVPTYAW